MKFDVEDVCINQVVERVYDLFICSTGYERRARFFTKKLFKLNKLQATKKLCLTFDGYKDVLDRTANDRFFDSQNIEMISVDELGYGGISLQLRKTLRDTLQNQKQLSILVDYSSMRRTTYGEIIQFAKYLALDGYEILVTFSYSTGDYMADILPKNVEAFVLIPGFEGIGSQKKEKFGIYNLGYEPITLAGVHEWVEPSKVVGIIAEPGVHPNSGTKSNNLNKEFISQTGCNVVKTSLFSVKRYCHIVNDITKSNDEHFDIVLLSTGPKPFTLGGLFCSILKPRISNIYIKGSESVPVNVEATGELVIVDATFAI